MSNPQKTRALRTYYFPCDFHQRRPFRKLRKEWPYTADWFILCCSIAREAMAGGRLEAGGQPLLSEDLEDLYDISPAWIDAALDSGLLEENEGGIAVPNWHEYFTDRATVEKSVTDTAAWQKFCLIWHRTGRSDLSSSELVDFAYEASINTVTRQDSPVTRANALGRILASAVGKSVNGLTVERTGTKNNTGLYSIRSQKSDSEDTKKCADEPKKVAVEASKSYPPTPEKREERAGRAGEGGTGGTGEPIPSQPNPTQPYPNLTQPNRILTVSQPNPTHPDPSRPVPSDPKTILISDETRIRNEAVQILSHFGDCGSTQTQKRLDKFLKKPGKPIEILRWCWAGQQIYEPDKRATTPEQFLDFASDEHRTRGWSQSQ